VKELPWVDAGLRDAFKKLGDYSLFFFSGDREFLARFDEL
jgi:hypothetical protein